MSDREERLEEALQSILKWANAYPLAVFPETTEEYMRNASRVLTEHGMTVDRISAAAMRHVLKGVGEIAREALR